MKLAEHRTHWAADALLGRSFFAGLKWDPELLEKRCEDKSRRIALRRGAQAHICLRSQPNDYKLSGAGFGCLLISQQQQRCMLVA